ncbi:EF-hand domain-containing protein [Ponticoccus litoralis]|uniref:EF-hand domain-containing protein n=1 Tax=Ponticoccus litoralis TaxID=422297 RepID=A0AAW9SP48_9RHOB
MKTTALSMTGLALVLMTGSAGLALAQAQSPAQAPDQPPAQARPAERPMAQAPRGGHGGPGFGMPILSYDADGDGRVTVEEVEARQAERFEAADADGNGLLSPEEVSAYAEALRAEREEMRRAARQAALIARMDADGDGQLSLDEISGVQPETSRFDRILDRLDTDGDGALTEEELQAPRKRMAERGAHRPEGAHGMHRDGDRKGPMQGYRHGEHHGDERGHERGHERGRGTPGWVEGR